LLKLAVDVWGNMRLFVRTIQACTGNDTEWAVRRIVLESEGKQQQNTNNLSFCQ
jgi:hypothetical protein